MWNINLNTPAKSMKGMLFKEPTEKSTSKLYNPKIDKISITTEGVPNQLYGKGCVDINTGKKFRNILEIREKNTAWGNESFKPVGYETRI